MSQQQFKAPPRIKDTQDMPCLKLIGANIGGERNPSLMFYAHHNVNNPSNSEIRAVVYTQTPDRDPKKQKIEVKMTLVDGETVLETIRTVAKSKEKEFEMMAYQTFRPKDYKDRKAGLMPDIKLIVGKNEKGVYLCLVHWNNEMPRIRFFFGSSPEDLFQFIVAEDKGQTLSQFSEIRAIAHSNILSKMISNYMDKYWVAWSKDGNRGNNNGNSNYKSGGGQSYKQPSYDSGAGNGSGDDLDDLPWD